MSDLVLSDEQREQIFAERVRPVIFPHPPADGSPELLFVVGQPGAGAARATSGLMGAVDIAAVTAGDLRVFHPRALDIARSRSVVAHRSLADSTTAWMRSALEHARTTGRSLMLDGTRGTPQIARATAALFAQSDFTTTVVLVGVPRAESLLATTSKYLLDARAGHPSQFTSVVDHDTGFDNTRILIGDLEATPSVDRLVVIGRDGAVRLQASRDEPATFSGARAALEREQGASLTAPQAMRWMSELRAMTYYALSSRQLARPLAESLIELHEVALREVLPRVPLPKDSQARPAAEASLARQLVAIRQFVIAERRPDAPSGPVIAPPGPDRGLSR